MAKIIYAHPMKRGYKFHLFTDLDFWDTRKIMKDLFEFLMVRRNFGSDPPGDEYPTQIVSENLSKTMVEKILYRLKRAIPSPPRHVVTREMVLNGVFTFEPYRYCPSRWSSRRVEHFIWRRLPLDQSALCDPYHTIKLEWQGMALIVRKQKREEKYDPEIRTLSEDRRRRYIPSSF